ncbi:MAG: malate/lactate/ureidoglycolate dehydrogenase [Burkholderiaceae bacterium]|nr:malate/lactate/ureidoglycolate dehydrogenase [Burkholderiaceae bacterium]
MPTIPAQQLEHDITQIVQAMGSQIQEAQTVAHNLVLANLKGHDSHGVGMIPRYAEALTEGALQLNQTVQVVSDLGSLFVLDAQRGYGQTTGEQAIQMGIERCKQHGSCIISLANAHHLGRIGHFAEIAALHGLVSIHLVNVLSSPVVAVWGGADGRHGTNPFCVGVPLKQQTPFILDFATSRAAQGKMRVAHNQGKKIQEGFLLDPQGRPTQDPSVVVKPNADGKMGALMPFGEHKGSGLAIACELIGGALTGSGTWKPRPIKSRAIWNGMLSILINPQQTTTQEQFDAEVASFIQWVKESPKANEDPVQIAGEPEQQKMQMRMQQGITIDEQTWGDIVEAAKRFGVSL